MPGREYACRDAERADDAPCNGDARAVYRPTAAVDDERHLCQPDGSAVARRREATAFETPPLGRPHPPRPDDCRQRRPATLINRTVKRERTGARASPGRKRARAPRPRRTPQSSAAGVCGLSGDMLASSSSGHRPPRSRPPARKARVALDLCAGHGVGQARDLRQNPIDRRRRVRSDNPGSRVCRCPPVARREARAG
jgi:hypothetical protein